MLILEDLERAKPTRARIYGEVTGYGTSNADAYRITDIHPEGRGGDHQMHANGDERRRRQSRRCRLCQRARTPTQQRQSRETMAIKGSLEDAAKSVAVSSIKSMTGHLIAAAGAVEAITCLLAIRDGVLPPTINYETPDPNCDLDYVPNQARQVQVDVALSNAMGLGGHDACVLLGRL